MTTIEHMRSIVSAILAVGLVALLAAAPAPSSSFAVAHRGASAYAPEHTLEAYRLALEQGAEYIEQDLDLTKDGVLVCSHDPSLERTTNVEEIFPTRFTEITVGGKVVKMWFIEDFTVAEIKRLDAGSWFDAKFAGATIPTFQEAIDLVKGKAGLFPELKTPGRVHAKGLNPEQAVTDVLRQNGLAGATIKGRPAVHLQVFEEDSLRRLATLLPEVPRSFLLGSPEQVTRWLTPEGLKEVRTFATGIAPAWQILDRMPDVSARAHAAGLTVVPYTFRLRPTTKEYPDASPEIRKMIDESSRELPDSSAALTAQMRKFVEVYKVDGLFTDNPDLFPR